MKKKKLSIKSPHINQENQNISHSVDITSDQRELSIAKQIIFTILVLFLFFVGSELVLSLIGVKPLILTEDPMVGFTDNVPLFVKQQRDDGTLILRTAKNKLQYFNDQSFPATKGENSYRIFCLGGSTTYGRPYNHKLSFSGWLHAYLKEIDPDTDWEVINAGGISYASYRVAKLMQELIQYGPDLFIVYSGQNEFLERRSYGKLTELPSWLINLDSMLNRIRSYSGLKRLYEGIRPESLEKAKMEYEVSGEVKTLLDYTAGPTSYHRDDTLQQQILKHYSANLERMVLMAKEANAEIIFITPVVNLRNVSPFKSSHKEGLSESDIDLFNSLLENGKQLYEGGNPSEALKLYNQAFEIDNRYADLHFAIGHALFDLKDYEKAEKAFKHAVDEDIAPLRALSYMRSILFDTVSKYDVSLVDFEQILKQEYLKEHGHPVFGNEFFMDHVHTDDERYRILGLSILNELKRDGIVSPEHTLNETQMEIVQKQVRSSLNREYHRQSLFNLAKVFDWAGKYEETKHLLKKNLELYGDQGEVYSLLGMTFLKNGEAAESISAFQKAIQMGYETPKLYWRLGDAYKEEGKFSNAFEAYKNKLRLDGLKHEAHLLYGILYAFQGDNKSAINHFTEALRLKPDFIPASTNMVGILCLEERYDDAMELAKDILNQDPKQYKMYFVISQILLERGDREGAIQYLSKTLNIAPDFKQAKESLSKVQQMASE